MTPPNENHGYIGIAGAGDGTSYRATRFTATHLSDLKIQSGVRLPSSRI